MRLLTSGNFSPVCWTTKTARCGHKRHAAAMVGVVSHFLESLESIVSRFVARWLHNLG
jgi:hypothetical protein